MRILNAIIEIEIVLYISIYSYIEVSCIINNNILFPKDVTYCNSYKLIQMKPRNTKNSLTLLYVKLNFTIAKASRIRDI